MIRYETLIRILDELRKEAPKEYKKYHPEENNFEKLFENVKCDGVTPNKENNEKTFKNTFSISR